MTDSQTAFRSALINASYVTALVPASNIGLPWNPKTPVVPSIPFNETDNYNNDDDYFDNEAKSDHMEVQCHIFTAPGATTNTAIAQAIDTALKADGWNRDFMQSLPDPGQYGHRVMRYSKRSTLTL